MNYEQMEAYIPEFNINGVIGGVTEWTKENRNTDPNAFELVNVFLFAGKYASEGSLIDDESLTDLWNIRSESFKNMGISEDNFVYKIVEASYESAIKSESLVSDPISHIALRRTAGVGLYLMQQKRDTGTMNYNNSAEMMELLKASVILKDNHPDLFEDVSVRDFTSLVVDLCPKDNLSNFQMKEITHYQSKINAPIVNDSSKII